MKDTFFFDDLKPGPTLLLRGQSGSRVKKQKVLETVQLRKMLSIQHQSSRYFSLTFQILSVGGARKN
jgi:hypothetical protein